MTDDPKVLIAEARKHAKYLAWLNDEQSPSVLMIRRLADALERAEGEGAKVRIYNPYGRLIEELAPGEEYHQSMDYE